MDYTLLLLYRDPLTNLENSPIFLRNFFFCFLKKIEVNNFHDALSTWNKGVLCVTREQLMGSGYKMNFYVRTKSEQTLFIQEILALCNGACLRCPINATNANKINNKVWRKIRVILDLKYVVFLLSEGSMNLLLVFQVFWLLWLSHVD